MKEDLMGAAKGMLPSAVCRVIMPSRYYSDAHCATNVPATLQQDMKIGHLMCSTMKAFITRRKVVTQFIRAMSIMYYVLNS